MKIFSQFQVTPAPGTRFIEGVKREAEELFGTQPPEIPEGEGEQNTYLVELHPGLRKASRDFIAHVYTLLTERASHDLTARPPLHPDAGPDPYSRLGSLLSEILSHTLERERRQGLLNLFWLAHSKEMSEVIEEFFSQSSIKGYIRYQVHPLVSGFYRNVHTTLLRRLKTLRPEVLRYNLGSDFNASLIESIIDDQLPLTEPDISRVNFSQILVDQNKRFRIGLKEFKEISSLCRERIRDIIRDKEEPFYGLIRRSLPSLSPEHFDDEKVIGKISCHSQVLHALFTDYTVLVPRLQKSSVLKSSAGGGGGWPELLTGYLDLLQALKRTEIIDILRRGITVVPLGLDDAQIRRFFVEGRLYRFHESAEVLNTARKVTVLFADLRGFTKTSERGISENELISSLYVIFDSVVSLVEQYHGKIDKFTGDGMMITFGLTRLTPDDELNALRTAIAIQGLLAELRREGRTHFHMGISVHSGRVQVAHFLVDEVTLDVTVIGRSVNIAGRLSGSGEKEGEETSGDGDPSLAAPGGGVRVGDDGTLYNWGIAVSQDTVDEIAKVVSLDPIAGGGRRGYQFPDAGRQKNILLEYVGDAKFKGIGRAIPVYECHVSA